jgi:hypothetical protein
MRTKIALRLTVWFSGTGHGCEQTQKGPPDERRVKVREIARTPRRLGLISFFRMIWPYRATGIQRLS